MLQKKKLLKEQLRWYGDKAKAVPGKVVDAKDKVVDAVEKTVKETAVAMVAAGLITADLAERVEKSIKTGTIKIAREGMKKYKDATDALKQKREATKKLFIDKAKEIKGKVVDKAETAALYGMEVKDKVEETVKETAATMIAAGLITKDAAEKVGQNIKDGTIKIVQEGAKRYKDATNALKQKREAAKKLFMDKAKQIKGKVSDAKDRMVEKAGEIRDTVVDAKDKTVETVKQKAADTKEKVVETKDKVVRGAVTAAAITVAGGLMVKEGAQTALEHGATYAKEAAIVTKQKAEQVQNTIALRKDQTKVGIKNVMAQKLANLQDKINKSILKDQKRIEDRQAKVAENTKESSDFQLNR